MYHIDIKWTPEGVSTEDSEHHIFPRITEEYNVQAPQGNGYKDYSIETLYTTAVNSCFMLTFVSLAKQSNISLKSFSCKSTGTTEHPDEAYPATEILIEPVVTIENPRDRERVMRLLVRSFVANPVHAKVKMKPLIQ